MSDCKIEKDICVDRHSGSMGKCRNCEFSTNSSPIAVYPTKWEMEFLEEHCEDDDVKVEAAVNEIFHMGIRSLVRKVKYGGKKGQNTPCNPR